MKKILLSCFVVLTFLFYILHKKTEDSEINVVPPSSLKNTETSLQNQVIATAPPVQSGTYKDGVYKGSVADAYYGFIQVQATITGGKITDVQFLKYPNDRSTSIMINKQAIPYLRQEAIKSQSAKVDIVTGATQSSIAFRQSLASALAKASQ